MKKIVIYQENVEPIILYDDDDDTLDSFSENISDLFGLKDVSVLNTTTGSFIVRPDKITSILVLEEEEDEIEISLDDSLSEKNDNVLDNIKLSLPPKKKLKKEKPKKKKDSKIEKEPEDIMTDEE